MQIFKTSTQTLWCEQSSMKYLRHPLLPKLACLLTSHCPITQPRLLRFWKGSVFEHWNCRLSRHIIHDYKVEYINLWHFKHESIWQNSAGDQSEIANITKYVPSALYIFLYIANNMYLKCIIKMSETYINIWYHHAMDWASYKMFWYSSDII